MELTKVIVGSIEGHPVYYSPASDVVECKDLKVPADALIAGYESHIDKEIIPCTSEKPLILRKFSGRNRLGCFNLTKEESKQLINTIKNERN